MPVHQIPMTRRGFLGGSAAALIAGLRLPAFVSGAEGEAANSFALVSDTHIPHSPDITARDVNMTKNLQQVVREICNMPQRPAGVIVTGDCAYLKGLPEDYANFAKTVQPLGEAKLPLHLMTGNHDRREAMREALAVQQPRDAAVASKFVSVLETPHANLILLDSLTTTNVVTGQLGDEQRAWLEKSLDGNSAKPAIVLVHHNLQFTPPPAGKPVGGLADSVEFFDLLKSKPQVKALIFGHTHRWNVTEQAGIQLINLPPTSYVFGKDLPNGWVEAQFLRNGLNLKLRTIDPAHPQNGESHQLSWT